MNDTAQRIHSYRNCAFFYLQQNNMIKANFVVFCLHYDVNRKTCEKQKKEVL